MAGHAAGPSEPAALLVALRAELHRLAQEEDDRAAEELARVPYWSPCPSTVHAHRAAAEALRLHAMKISAPAAHLVQAGMLTSSGRD